MEFHPSQIPVSKTYDVADEKAASEAAEDMVRAGFGQRAGFRALFPKEKKAAKRIGYTIVTAVNYGLRQAGAKRDIRYWTYHYDKDRYCLVLVGAEAFDSLGL